MDVAEGFVVRRPLGAGGDGYLPFAALTAIHMAHRLGALVLVVALAAFAWRLHVAGATTRRWALALLGLVAWQAASGLGNVLLGWPLAAALAHTAAPQRWSSSSPCSSCRSAAPRTAATPVDAGRAPALAS